MNYLCILVIVLLYASGGYEKESLIFGLIVLIALMVSDIYSEIKKGIGK